jgi:multidrug efflux system outer membrane protein
MNTINKYVVLMAVLVLSACTVSKDVKTPQAALPAAFRNATATTDTTSIADIPWKSFFTDAELQKLIDSAIVKNYDMQLAIKNIEASQLLVKQVKWNYVPAVGLNVSASTSRPSDNSLNGLSLANAGIGTKHVEDYSANLSLSWEADIWGKIRNQQQSCFSRLFADY